ncbi:MAG: hypothetical protein CVT64_01645 [Actinobacteria bacterium HGW-Actinobacteria-4]|nr:MAG: hypothetical protein CVT64_01645 [Actinobacteria bacterium HGW-Actinobacteria-4]
MRIDELIGVYDANGGWRGEASYVVGHLLGTRNCALCDVTHSAVRRKPQWDTMVRNLGVPFALLHRNEMPADVTSAVGEHPLPLVLARVDDHLRMLMPADDVALANGSVTEFEVLARAAADAAGWNLG